MIEFLAMIYGLLAIFVLQSIERNQRDQRRSPAIVTALGWGLCSMSATLALLALGVAAGLMLQGGFDVTSLELPAA